MNLMYRAVVYGKDTEYLDLLCSHFVYVYQNQQFVQFISFMFEISKPCVFYLASILVIFGVKSIWVIRMDIKYYPRLQSFIKIGQRVNVLRHPDTKTFFSVQSHFTIFCMSSKKVFIVKKKESLRERRIRREKEAFPCQLRLCL